MNACGDSRLRGLRSRKPIGFRQWVVHQLVMSISEIMSEGSAICFDYGC